MCPSLLHAILTPKASQGRPQSLPEGPKMHPKTGKDRCEKTSRFRAGFIIVLVRFSVVFLMNFQSETMRKA